MKLEIVKGLNTDHAAKLNNIGLTNTDKFLEACRTKAGRRKVAEDAGIEEDLILTWANYVDLFRINGVREQYARLLEAAGVDTVPELAQRNPDNLYEAMKATNDEEKLAERLPGKDQVADWVRQAKELPRMLEY